ncbi:MAG: hypothetical protein Q4A98_00300 [Comamonadaceae bacterium]|nr:hypothetical protein [Comamonadaceae bacterium]
MRRFEPIQPEKSRKPRLVFGLGFLFAHYFRAGDFCRIFLLRREGRLKIGLRLRDAIFPIGPLKDALRAFRPGTAEQGGICPKGRITIQSKFDLLPMLPKKAYFFAFDL